MDGGPDHDDAPDGGAETTSDRIPASDTSPPPSREWRHPSEMGHSRRVHADRRRSRLLVLGLVAVGAGMLVGTAAVVSHWSTPDDATAGSTPISSHPVEGSLAMVQPLAESTAAPVTGLVVDSGRHVVMPASPVAVGAVVHVHAGGDMTTGTVVDTTGSDGLALVRLGAPLGQPVETETVTTVAASSNGELTLMRFDGHGNRWTGTVTLTGTDAEHTADDGTTTDGLLSVHGATVPDGVLADDEGHLVGWVMAGDGETLMAYPADELVRDARELVAENG